VNILTPAPDSVVRERVPIKVPASAVPQSSPPGYVVVSIDGKFEAAVARPLKGGTVTYIWDTKEPTPTGQRGVKDGKHEIRVTVAGPDGKQVGNADRVEVFVQNSVRTPPAEVYLHYKFNPGAQHTYVQRITVKQSDQELYKARVVLQRLTDDVLGDTGMLRERIDRDSAQSEQGQPVPFPTAGQSVTFNVRPQGVIIPGRKMQRTGEKPVLNLPLFPSSPIRVGQSWNAPVKLSPMYQGLESLTLPAESAKHTLEGFEWQNGVPTAKIVAKLDGTAVIVSQGQPTGYKISGDRTIYFDWKKGRIVKILDDYSMVSSTTSLGGTVSLGGPSGTAAPGYNPYSPTGGAADLSTAIKVESTVQLTG
jgi:hypothetical protein